MLWNIPVTFEHVISLLLKMEFLRFAVFTVQDNKGLSAGVQGPVSSADYYPVVDDWKNKA